MLKIITPEKLKTALSEMKTNIVNKFYNKTEIDNTIRQTKLDINGSIKTKLDENNIEIKKETVKVVEDKLLEYDETLEQTITDKVNEKQFDTSALISKTELDITKVITTDNLEANKIATKDDLANVQIDTSTLLDKETFVSQTDNASVKKSDVSKSVDGISQAVNSSYYGKDKDGNVGFHVITTDSSGNVNYDQLSEEELTILINNLVK